MTDRPGVRVPPRWVVTTAWRVHRGLLRLTRHRAFLWTPRNKRGWGALELTTTGRRSGQPRTVVVGYLEDGPRLVLLAMNGWAEGHPLWWLNLHTTPTATVRLAKSAPTPVTSHLATGDEHDRLWALWRSVEPKLDEYAALRSTSTDVVVLTRV